MNAQTLHENRDLIGFWDRFFKLSGEDREAISNGALESWEELAPCEKLLSAVRGLGGCKKVLDFGCGNGWAAIAAAKSGCPSVTAADAAPNAVEAAGFLARYLGVDGQVETVCCREGWLSEAPSGEYDGLICCCVLDTVPAETALEMLSEAARIVTDGAEILIALNAHITPEAAAEKGLELTDEGKVFADGVLRLVSRTDEEWETMLSRFFTVVGKEHYAWPGETEEKRRLFRLRKKTV